MICWCDQLLLVCGVLLSAFLCLLIFFHIYINCSVFYTFLIY
jgi:hypothetical protein